MRAATTTAATGAERAGVAIHTGGAGACPAGTAGGRTATTWGSGSTVAAGGAGPAATTTATDSRIEFAIIAIPSRRGGVGGAAGAAMCGKSITPTTVAAVGQGRSHGQPKQQGCRRDRQA